VLAEQAVEVLLLTLELVVMELLIRAAAVALVQLHLQLLAVQAVQAL
jgi:hypothetical protein